MTYLERIKDLTGSISYTLKWIAAVVDAQTQHLGYQVEPANPFMMLRRPGDCA